MVIWNWGWGLDQSGDKPASSFPPRNDVYSVYFGKAAPGKAAQLADLLKTLNPKDPTPQLEPF
jgi:hypothetical protein